MPYKTVEYFKERGYTVERMDDMVHTEESLMALADRLAVLAQFASDHLDERNALRLAIREVLAERDAAINAYQHLHDMYENLKRENGRNAYFDERA